MNARRTLPLSLLPIFVALALSARAEPEFAPEGRVVVELEPVGRRPIGGVDDLAFVSGRAFVIDGGEVPSFDVIFVIDQSESTSRPSGADVNGDGSVRRFNGITPLVPAPNNFLGNVIRLPFAIVDIFVYGIPSYFRGPDPDSILQAEVKAVEVLLDQLDPRLTHVGVVAFSGDRDPDTPDADLTVPLTDDYERVRRGLAEALEVGPVGLTNFAAAARLATKALATSARRDRATPRVFFFTDGKPTLPFGYSNDANAEEAIRATTVAAKRGIAFDTFALGSEATSDPAVLIEMARRTKGRFFPVNRAGDLPDVWEGVELSPPATVRVQNATTGAGAAYLTRGADGTFGALLPMRPGINEVVAIAVGPGGGEASARMTVEFAADGEVQPLDIRQLRDRTRLLDARLADARARNDPAR